MLLLSRRFRTDKTLLLLLSLRFRIDKTLLLLSLRFRTDKTLLLLSLRFRTDKTLCCYCVNTTFSHRKHLLAQSIRTQLRQGEIDNAFSQIFFEKHGIIPSNHHQHEYSSNKFTFLSVMGIIT